MQKVKGFRLLNHHSKIRLSEKNEYRTPRKYALLAALVVKDDGLPLDAKILCPFSDSSHEIPKALKEVGYTNITMLKEPYPKDNAYNYDPTQFDACIDNPPYDRKGGPFMFRCNKAYRFASVLTSYNCVNIANGSNPRRSYLELLYNCIWAVEGKPRQLSIFIRKATQEERERYIAGERNFRKSINASLYDDTGKLMKFPD